MNNLFFDTNHKVILSKEAKFFAYCTGVILIAVGFFGLYKVGFNSPQNPLQIVLLLAGLLWIVKGVLGKEFFAIYRYIKMDSETLVIKNKSNRPDLFKLSEIEEIKLRGTNLILCIQDYVKEYSLSWLSYEQVQELKSRLEMKKSENKI